VRGLREAQELLVGAVSALDQAPDRLEVEALVLERADELEPRDVGGAVVTGPSADFGRREEAPRLVRAHVAHGHAGLPRQLVDRQRGVGHTSMVLGFMLHGSVVHTMVQ
jgi:hypothetical protein